MKKRFLAMFVLLAWILFIGGIKVGYDWAATSTSPSHAVMPHSLQPTWNGLWYVISQNILTAGTLLVGSVLTFGVIGIIILFSNGTLVGGIIVRAEEAHLSNTTIFFALIPHGIFEISSLGLLLGVAIWSSYQCIGHWFFRVPWPSKMQVDRALYQALGGFILLIFAGVVENFVTPLFLMH